MTPASSTGLVALLGNPVGQSVSPALHNAAFEDAGLDLVYIAARVSGPRFREAATGLHALGALGANVTVPHKRAAWNLAEALGPMAAAAGAVNTLVRTPTGWSGHNTDVEGFAKPLRETNVDLRDARALVIGAGGAARAAVLALRDGFGLSRIDVAARRTEQAGALVEDLASGGNAGLRAVALGDADTRARLVVNATPVGMHDAAEMPYPGAQFTPDQVVYDLVYGPERTRLVHAARAAGATTLDGLAMLIGQAAGSFQLWTGREMNTDLAMRVARDALAAR